MSDSANFMVRDIVWAKVNPYPWWPAKIVKKIRQNNAPVYKVSFFADSTYSFLHHQQLKSFELFDFDLNSSFPSDFKLQKAIQQAEAAFQKRKISDRTTDEEQLAQLLHIVQSSEKSSDKLQIEPIQSLEQKSPMFEIQETNHDSSIIDFLNAEITCDNVINLIQIHSASIKKEPYSYSKRKQSMKFKQKLRDALLLKYKLTTIQSAENNQSNVCQEETNVKFLSFKVEKNSKKIFKIKHLKRKNQPFYFNFDKTKIASVKKIQKQINFKGVSPSKSKFISLQLLNLLNQRSQNDITKFKKLAIGLLNSLKAFQKNQFLDQNFNFRDHLIF